MTLLVDAGENAIASHITTRTLRRAERSARSELQAVLDRCVRNVLGSATASVEGEAASDLLSKAIRMSDLLLRNWANAYSSLQWLWMLRRLPPGIFAGTLTTTRAYDATLAETLVAWSTTGSKRISSPVQLAFSIRALDVERLLRFCSGVRVLSHLHVLYRWSGKGSPICFRSKKDPIAMPDPNLERAVRLYDERVSTSTFHFSNVGAPVPETLISDRTSFVGISRIEPLLTTCPIAVGGEEVELLAQFIPHHIDLEPVLDLLLNPHVKASISREAAALLCLLASVPILVSQHRMLPGLLQRGYMAWNWSRLSANLSSIFEIAPTPFKALADESGLNTPGLIISELIQAQPSTWPLIPGPPIRRHSDFALIDFAAVVHRLERILNYPSGGAAANARALAFELRVQAILDDSQWKPDAYLRDLRGKTLRIGGSAITDVDAIASLGDKLLLVSCKSMLYSADYDIGDYRTVANRASALTDAVCDWKRKVAALRSAPKGDNYNFTRFNEFYGCVCTPTVLFAPLQVMLEQAAPGLGVTCSLPELSIWARPLQNTHTSP